VADLRCPFCHDALDREREAWLACGSCLARHHAACWEESGRCATCRDPVALTRNPSRVSPVYVGVCMILATAIEVVISTIAIRSHVSAPVVVERSEPERRPRPCLRGAPRNVTAGR
jgi:hypothetical protein